MTTVSGASRGDPWWAANSASASASTGDLADEARRRTRALRLATPCGGAQVAVGASPVHRRADGARVDPLPVSIDKAQQGRDEAVRQQVGGEAEIEQLGVGRPVVVALLLDPGVVEVLDLRAGD